MAKLVRVKEHTRIVKTPQEREIVEKVTKEFREKVEGNIRINNVPRNIRNPYGYY